MKLALKRIGLGLCLVSVLLGIVAVGSFWFTPGSGHFNTGEMYDESLESNNDAVRESLPDGYTLPKTRAEMHRENAVFGLIASSILFVCGSLLYIKSRKLTQ